MQSTKAISTSRQPCITIFLHIFTKVKPPLGRNSTERTTKYPQFFSYHNFANFFFYSSVLCVSQLILLASTVFAVFSALTSNFLVTTVLFSCVSCSSWPYLFQDLLIILHCMDTTKLCCIELCGS